MTAASEISIPITVAWGANAANHAALYPNPQPASKIVCLFDKYSFNCFSELNP
tara:strand:- start:2711 stop:2869 length:159 start_codon:yes stop_codon:yes gene_type:complete